MGSRLVAKHSWTPEQELAVLEMHRKLQCGPSRLARALPEIEGNLLRTMFDRLELASASYHCWAKEEEDRLVKRHKATGYGATRLAKEFPKIPANAITSKLGALRRAGRLPKPKRRPMTKLTNTQHRAMRDFIAANRSTYRLEELTRRWNVEAAKLSYPSVTMDTVRYWARRKPKKHGKAAIEPGAFAEADRKAKETASAQHRAEFETEASKLHEAAKAKAAKEIAAKPKRAKEKCRWCEWDFPHTPEYFKVEDDKLVVGICIWCRDRQRRDLKYAKAAGTVAHQQYKQKMKREKRKRFYDVRWEAVRTKRLQLLVKLRARCKPPPEQDCLKCEESYPQQAPFYRPPPPDSERYGRVCCFCMHDFDIRIKRAKADGEPVEPIINERRALIVRANTEARTERIAALKRAAKGTRGPRANCSKCNVPWPVADEYVKKFWRLDGSRRRHCLICDWEIDLERRRASSVEEADWKLNA